MKSSATEFISMLIFFVLSILDRIVLVIQPDEHSLKRPSLLIDDLDAPVGAGQVWDR